MKSGGHHPQNQPQTSKKEEKEKKLKEQKELALLFKPVQDQKIDKGKSIIFTKKKFKNLFSKNTLNFQELILNLLFVLFSNRDNVVKVINVNSLMIYQLKGKMLNVLCMLICEMVKKKLWKTGMIIN